MLSTEEVGDFSLWAILNHEARQKYLGQYVAFNMKTKDVIEADRDWDKLKGKIHDLNLPKKTIFYFKYTKARL